MQVYKSGFIACVFPGMTLQGPWPGYAEMLFAHWPRAKPISLLAPGNAGQHRFSFDWQI